MPTYKTPGVYVEEIPTLPPSVAEVSTAVPAFIGYTEKGPAVARVDTLLEYEETFGGPEQAARCADEALRLAEPDFAALKEICWRLDFRSLAKEYEAGAGIEALLTETAAIQETLLRARAADDLRLRARNIELELLELQLRLEGNETRSLYSEEGPVSIERRLEVAVMGTFRSTYGPTPTHQRSVEIADSQFAEVKSRLTRISDSDLPALRRDLDTAGVPWTPGRPIPAPDER